MNAGQRVGCALLALLGAVALWQTGQLEMWTFQGPGAGLFPRAVAIAMIALAAVCVVMPRRSADTGSADAVASFADAAPDERRTGLLYAIALIGLVPGAAWAGFWVTAFVLVTFLMRMAERRSWRASVGFGVIVATVGLALFGALLRVTLPTGPLDRWLTALLRGTGV